MMNSAKATKSKGNKKKVNVYTNRKKFVDSETAVIEKLRAQYETIDKDTVKKFTDLPLSTNTLKGLKGSGYVNPTEIQKETISLSLQGKDILGAAQTGSGKTLAFLIPVLELLYCHRWTRLDGVGALVITPTRELAYQIFETLRKIGRLHDFSAGLIIGGKDLKFERKRMDQCNIVICTPGRLLHHMDENPLFDCVNMKILVLDEADRCLDLGFEQTMNAVIANLPPKRQTLLFSATQTKSVKDLARLSLKDPCYVSVHEHSEYSTPKGLEQSYVICKLEDKISILWSFIKNHQKKKSIIFFSSCKQVKYVYEIFCKLRPGLSILALYGTLHQMRRMDIYESFCRKTSAVLFATDIASRGLDFPEVNWVVQADCPEDPETYIHRVGRTARYHRGGESLLLLLPSEENMVEKLLQRKIPIKGIEINPIKLNNPVRKMEAYLAKDPSLKESAQRAFVAYAKAVFLMKDKSVFDVQALDTDAFSKSLGLAIPPRIRFLKKLTAKTESSSNQPKKIVPNNKKYFDIDEDDGTEKNPVKTMDDSDSGVSESEIDFEKPVSGDDVKTGKASFQLSGSDSDSDEDMFMVKRKDHDIDLPTEQELNELNSKNIKKKVISKAAAAKKILRKKIAPNKKIVFNDEGEAVVSGTKEKRSELALQYENDTEGGLDLEKAKLVLREEDKFDKKLFQEKVKLKHREEKSKRKSKQKKQQQEQEQDDFGTDSESEGPDLSWLPDPDKIYGKAESESENEGDLRKEESTEVEPLNITPSKSSKKRKMKTDKNNPIKKKKMQLADVSSALSINEAEELAMMLLHNKN